MDARLSFLFDKSNDFFCVFDKNGTIKHTNSALRKTLGYSEAELYNVKINTLSHPADVRRREELATLLLRKKEITGHETRIKGIDGRYYNIKWSLFFNSHDDLIYASGTNLTNKLNGPNQNNLTDNIQHIIQSFSEGFFIINNKWQITAYNPAFLAITGLNNKQLKNISLKKLHSLGITDEVITKFEAAFSGNTTDQAQYFNKYFNRWLRINIYPFKHEVMVFIRDINTVKIQQLILALEKNILELNASSSQSLQQTINELLKGIEEIFPDMICSVLEVDEAQERVYHLAAPRLAVEFCNSINGTAIGPKAGSCGTSVYHRSQVIVSDIEKDSLWEDYSDIARPYGLKACWSTPVISSQGAHVLATFAVYYTTAREPKGDELSMIERTVNILRVLMENKRNQDNIKDQNKRLQEIASISSHEIRRPVATILGLVNLFDKKKHGHPDE
ncbi:PAS domain S-box protein [uncultured Mucilaginibacter sp.]|uniref:PAS domain S-box protein n=1 Tax=uncultured Mucilaginibacter sp. TaxID=797541 RepID=UPI0025FB9BEA|nr:PAS domain S-box protein [uncultured Mucilaginibacter sp.]